MKVAISLSGGMDSTTLLGYIIQNIKDLKEIIAVSFIYPSKHNQYEIEAAKKVVEYYKEKSGVKIEHIIMDVSKIFEPFESDLLKKSGPIPEGHYASDNMKATVVPVRNIIFGSILAGIANSKEANKVYLGVHAGDHHIYPDCRENTMKAFEETIRYATDHEVDVRFPFINFFKEDILNEGFSFEIPTPYHLTRTCYKNQELSCGKCGSCTERLEAFKNINRVDPIKYEED